MSNGLALATVTAVLEERVRSVMGAVGLSSLPVTTDHPRQPTDTGTFIKLIRLSPHAQLRSMDLPTRGFDGYLVERPRLPVVLDYMFTFMGSATEREPERMAGYVMTELHARPILTRDEILAYLSGLGGSDPLAGSDLADQVEQVKLTLMSMEMEDFARAWGILNQSFYGISVIYQASVVWLEDAVRPPSPLPVMTPSIRVRPGLMPEITRVTAAGRSFASWEESETLTIEGTGLRGETTWLRIGGRTFPVADADVRDDRISFVWTPALSLQAGVAPVQVLHRADYGYGTPDTFRTIAESNAAGVQLAPNITGVGAVSTVPGAHRITLTVRPVLAATQDIALLMDRTGSGEHVSSSTVISIAGDQITFEIAGLTAGTWLARVRVDGAVSRLTASAPGPFDGPSVVIP